jgi:hypothetical protein
MSFGNVFGSLDGIGWAKGNAKTVGLNHTKDKAELFVLNL